MEIFAREADRLFATYGTGDARVLVGLRLGKGGENPSIVKLPPVGDRQFAPLDEPEILRAVLDGVQQANGEHKTHYFPNQILYVTNDPPDYSLFRLCASLIISRVAIGAEFPSMNTNES